MSDKKQKKKRKVPKNFHGKKGRSGRKPAYQEKRDAEFLMAAFYDDHDLRVIKEKIESGNYSAADKFIEKLLEGRERMMEIAVKKIFPDKQEIDARVESKQQLMDLIEDEQDSKSGIQEETENK